MAGPVPLLYVIGSSSTSVQVTVPVTNRGSSWSAPVTVSGAAQGYAFFQGLDVAPNGRVDLGYQALKAVNPATFGTGNAAIDAYGATKPVGQAWSAPLRLTAVSSDPAASAQNNLQLQFWGDYNDLASSATSAAFIFTDARHGVGCPAVDAYQRFLAANGLVIREDGEDRFTQRTTGVNPALSDPSEKPAPQVDCTPQFGNTDVVVARFAP